jgi:phosphate-selective porin OprO/OprP
MKTMKTLKPPFGSLFVVASLLSTGAALAADGASVEERLKKLESQLEQVLKENTELKKQLGWDGKKPLNLVEDKGKAGAVGLGGYLQTQIGLGGTPDPRFAALKGNDSFSLRRARLHAYGKFAENFDFMLQGEFGGLGSGMNVQMTDGYINWNRYEAANIKVGQYKAPFGYERLLPGTAIPFIERSYMSERFAPHRQVGASVNGSVLENRLAYAAGVFNGNNVNNGLNDSDDFMVAARVEGTPVKTKVGKQDLTWALGVNGFSSDDRSVSLGSYGFRSVNGLSKPDNMFVGNRVGVGADTQLRLGPFGLLAEFIVLNYQPDNGNWTATPVDDDFNSCGYYVAATYDVIPKRLQALARWESTETDDNVGNSDADMFSAGLTYFLKGDSLKLMANYLYGQIEDEDWESRFLMRLQLCF